MLATSSATDVSTQAAVLRGAPVAPQSSGNPVDRVTIGSGEDSNLDASRRLADMARQASASNLAATPAPAPSVSYAKVHPVTVTLASDVPAPFQGAKVTTMVENDGSLEKDADLVMHLRETVAMQIRSGRILATTPGQKLTTKDLFDARHNNYLGVLKYNADGTKTIERLQVAG